MSDLKQTRDLTPQPVTGEYASRPHPGWHENQVRQGDPIDRSEDLHNLQHRISIPAPDHAANAALAIPAAAGATASTPIITTPQAGEVRAVTALLTNALSAGTNLITIAIQNYVGQVYFSTVLSLTTTALTAMLWDLADLRLPFYQGLYLTVTNGAAQGSNQGEISVTLIWKI